MKIFIFPLVVFVIGMGLVTWSFIEYNRPKKNLGDSIVYMLQTNPMKKMIVDSLGIGIFAIQHIHDSIQADSLWMANRFLRDEINRAKVAPCNLSAAELKSRNLYRDTTAYTWIVNDPETCISVAFGRKRDGEIVIRDFNRTLQLLQQNHQDSLFNKILLDHLLKMQEPEHHIAFDESDWTYTTHYMSSYLTVKSGHCYTAVFQHRHNQTGEMIEWKAPCSKSERKLENQ